MGFLSGSNTIDKMGRNLGAWDRGGGEGYFFSLTSNLWGFARLWRRSVCLGVHPVRLVMHQKGSAVIAASVQLFMFFFLPSSSSSSFFLPFPRARLFTLGVFVVFCVRAPK